MSVRGVKRQGSKNLVHENETATHSAMELRNTFLPVFQFLVAETDLATSIATRRVVPEGRGVTMALVGCRASRSDID